MRPLRSSTTCAATSIRSPRREIDPQTASPDPVASASVRAAAASWPSPARRVRRARSEVLAVSTIWTTSVSSSPRVISSAASNPSASSAELPVRFANSATTTRRGSSDAGRGEYGECGRQTSAVMTNSSPTAAIATMRWRPARGTEMTASAAIGGGSSGADDSRVDNDSCTGDDSGADDGRGAAVRLVSRARTAAMSAVVSGAGATSYSSASRAAKDSYACTAPARSPSSPSRVICLRSDASSSRVSAAARRAQWIAIALSPAARLASASRHAASHARRRRMARSSSSQCSNSGAPEMKKPSSRSPR